MYGNISKTWMAIGAKSALLLSALLVCVDLAADERPAFLKELAPNAARMGAYDLRWFSLPVYEITLYTENRPYATNDAAVLSLRYQIPIKHKRLQETTLREWLRLDKGTAEQRAAWIKQLDSLWPDIQPGDSLTAVRRANGPTIFLYRDRLLGQVDDAAFGPAFFSIWLDENCRYPKMRDSLLGKDVGPKNGE